MFAAIFIVAVIVLVFVAGRNFTIWYFRIDRTIELLESIDGHLKNLDKTGMRDES